MKQRRRHCIQVVSIVTAVVAAAHFHHRIALAFQYRGGPPFEVHGRFRSRPSLANQKFGQRSSISSSPVKLEPFAVVISAEERKRRQRRRATPNNNNNNYTRRKPPLVDSDLLRFLNTTQTLWNIDDDHNRCNLDTNLFDLNIDTDVEHETIAASVTPTPTVASSISDDINSNKERLRFDSSYFTAWNENSSIDQSMQEWMKQYECTYIVARLHQQYGATIEAAYAVGITIERIAIFRAQQKRLRSYCKLRNQIWKRNNSISNGDASDSNDRFLADRNAAFAPNIDVATAASEEFSTYSEYAQVDEDMCDIVPFNHDCSNHNNMDEIINVMMEYGLSSKDICEILIVSPSIAFMQPRRSLTTARSTKHNMTTTLDPTVGTQQSLQEILDRIFVGLLMGSNRPYELKLRKYDARKVLRNTPGILTVRGSQSACQIIQLLINLGVSTNSLSRDKSNLPILLSRQPNDVFRLVAFLSSDAVRMPVSKIGPLLRRTEAQDLLNAIAPSRSIVIGQQRTMVEPSRQKYVSSNVYTLYNGLIRGTNTKNTSPSYVVTQMQKVVVNDMYRRMSETAWTLRNKIGTSDLGRVIAAYPSVLLLDATRQILPTAQYLMNDLDILPNDLPSILQLYPALLRTDVEQMRNVVSYLTSLAVAEDNLGSIFRSFPVLLTLDIEHDMEPVVEFLQSIGVSNVGRFISRLPPVLGYSVEDELRPKFDYLNAISSDARFKITKFPAYFSYPLERVIKSRFEYLRTVKRIPTPLLALDHILCSGDKDFATKVCQDANVAQYSQFIQDRQDAIRRPASGDPGEFSFDQEEVRRQPQQSSIALNPKIADRDMKSTASTGRNEESPFPPGAAAIPS